MNNPVYNPFLGFQNMEQNYDKLNNLINRLEKDINNLENKLNQLEKLKKDNSDEPTDMYML